MHDAGGGAPTGQVLVAFASSTAFFWLPWYFRHDCSQIPEYVEAECANLQERALQVSMRRVTFQPHLCVYEASA